MAFKFNPLTGQLDIVGAGSTSPDNFSYTLISSGASLEVPSGQLMIFTQDLMVEGNLIVSGDILDLDQKTFDFWTNIPDTESVIVDPNRLMLFRSPFVVSGNIRVLGDLLEI